MAKRKAGKDYFGLGRVISLVLVIIPVTSLILGIIVKIQQKQWLGVIVRIFFGWNIIWILDIIFMVLEKRIFPLL
ncbi:MAG: hypothetical protein GX813_04185 [Erysipelotrichia bacterium]|nr:hypothetical protein [Erysipelotrichia bacterium]